MVRGHNLKLIAISLMLLFIFQLGFPTLSFALTGGPSSPETSSFTPVGSSDLVDLSTGDFSYNIPLLTVPGPNGGYPINIGYKAGVTMEQEGSWVGLGWDLNVGAITRNLRGLPDDFNGDQVKQTLTYKPTEIISNFYRLNMKKKLFGKELELNSVEVTFSRNNYTGFSFGVGAGLEVGDVRLAANFDSKDGISLNPSYMFGEKSKKLLRGIRLGAGFSSKSGFNSINFSRLSSVNKGVTNLSAGVNFAKISPIGEISTPQKTTTTFAGFGGGSYKLGKYTEAVNQRVSHTIVSLKDVERIVNSYGYMNLEKASKDDLTDFHKENQLTMYNESPIIAMPVLDNDVYSITGQGISGNFRAFRSDIPMLSPNYSESSQKNRGGTAEWGVGTTAHLGASGTKGDGVSITGKWGLSNSAYPDGHMAELEDEIFMAGKTPDQPLYRPFYFDYMGKQTLADQEYFNNIEGNIPVGYDLSLSSAIQVEDMWSRFGELSSPSFNRGIRTNMTQKRNISTNHINYYTKQDILVSKLYHQKHPLGKSHHIHEISVTNTSGTRYVYGLPVYNKQKQEVIFSLDSKGESVDAPRVNFTKNEASKYNHPMKKIYFISIP